MWQIRLFQPTDTAYEAIAAIDHAVWPDSNSTVDSLKRADATLDPDVLYQRLVIQRDKKIVAYAYVREQPGAHQPGKYIVGIFVHPDYERQGIGTVFYSHILQMLQQRSPRLSQINAYTRDDKPQAEQFLQQQGFQLAMRWVVSWLNLNDFDPAPWASLRDKIAAQGIQLLPLTEVQTTDTNWQHKLYDLEWVLQQDEPSSSPRTRLSFARFVTTRLEVPSFQPDAWFVAVDKDAYIGMCQLQTDDVHPEHIWMGLTGVISQYRRLGIATALCWQAICYAQQVGKHKMYVSTEEKNPMVQLVQKLGFVPEKAALAFEKRF
jgi:GNAT superfamily N-acetyltransferase